MTSFRLVRGSATDALPAPARLGRCNGSLSSTPTASVTTAGDNDVNYNSQSVNSDQVFELLVDLAPTYDRLVQVSSLTPHVGRRSVRNSPEAAVHTQLHDRSEHNCHNIASHGQPTSRDLTSYIIILVSSRIIKRPQSNAYKKYRPIELKKRPRTFQH